MRTKISNHLSIRLMANIIFLLLLLFSAGCQLVAGDSEQNMILEKQNMTGYVKTDGAKLYYEYFAAAQSNETVFFIHGSTGNSSLWEQQVPVFVEAGFNVVVFDLRNAGKSEAELGKASLGTIADDVESIRIALNLDDIYIVGQALGGEGALEYSVRYKEHTKAIVVVASYRAADAEPAFVALRNKLAPPANFAGRTGLQMRLSAYYLENNQAGVRRFVEIDRLNKARQSVDGKLDQKRLKASVQSTGITLDYAQLSKIKVPTLILSSERDDITPPALMSEVARQIPRAQYKTVPNAGRYSFWENPPEFNKIVMGFLKEIKNFPSAQ